jgi:hypothetical protein
VFSSLSFDILIISYRTPNVKHFREIYQKNIAQKIAGKIVEFLGIAQKPACAAENGRRNYTTLSGLCQYPKLNSAFFTNFHSKFRYIAQPAKVHKKEGKIALNFVIIF